MASQRAALSAAAISYALSAVAGFANPSIQRGFGLATSKSLLQPPHQHITSLCMSQDTFIKRPDDDDTVVSFVDLSSEGEKAIDCYIDSVATLNNIEYTIGTPCDYAVALCYFESDEQLVPIELDDALMDDIFPVAEGIIEDEFGEELVLLRTPQTLTLIGELEESEMDEEEEDDMDEMAEDTEEEVEILVSFEEEGREYHLVRLLDPILLVGKVRSMLMYYIHGSVLLLYYIQLLIVSCLCFGKGRE